MRKSSSRCQMELGSGCEAMAAAMTCLTGLSLTNKPSRPQGKTLHLERNRNHKNNYYAGISFICLVVALAFVTQNLQSPIRVVEAAEAAVKATSQQQAPVNQTASATTNRKATGTKDANAAKTNQQPDSSKDQKASKKSTPASLEPEATDLSSMYVQIPIAEPVGEANSAADQQSQQEVSQEADSGADSTKATTWTGPWPKKFQIGYIKQSDLHQVLIESLKNDPFIGTSKSTAAPSSKTSATKSAVTQAPVATKSAPASDAASLMVSGYPQLKAVQQTVSGNHDHQQQRPSIGAQQNQNQQQQQQQYWPSTVQTYGRLALPHVMMPRPKGNLYVPGSFIQQHQNAQQHHRNARHQLGLAGQNHLGHMQQPGLGTPNSYRQNVHFGHAGRQQNGHHMQLLIQQQQQQQQQQQPKAAMMSSFIAQPGPQYQFASLPSSSMRNQPVYTMNNFATPQQQQPQQSSGIDADPMQLLQMANLGAGQQQVGYGPAAGHLNTMNRAQPPKNSDYIASSWRPVTSQDEERQLQQNSNEANMNDGFDDGFNMPNGAGKDSGLGQNSSSSSDSMNRHPALNSYLGQQAQQNSSSKVSPANVLKNREQPGGGIKSKSAGSTKGAREDDGQQQKTLLDDGSTKSGTGRRALPNNSPTSAQNATGTTTTPTSPIGGQNGTTIAQENADSTTAASVTTTTTLGGPDGSSTTSATFSNSSSDTTTSSSQEETTTEPDSEVIEGEATTEPTDQEVATTTASSIESLGRNSSTVAPDSSSTSGSADSEAVATQTPASAATFPRVQSEEASTSNPADSTTTNGNREETTPNSLSAPSSSTASAAGASQPSSTTNGGEVEGLGNSTMQSASLRNGRTDVTLSDEQLMAAARASDLTKSKSAKTSTKGRSLTGQQASASVTAKRARSSNTNTNTISQSSERLLQASQTRPQSVEPSSSTTGASAAGRKSQQTKLVTRRPEAAASRAAKQLAGGSKLPTSGGAQAAALKQKPTRPANQKKQPKSGSKSTQTKARKASSQKITRMVQGERLQAAQVVSMTPAQAQSSAQTLASLLLSRCLSSSNCAHLLDVCSTKQAAVPINLQPTDTTNAIAANSNNNNNNTNLAAWSMPIGLMSSQLMSLMEALQADRALKLLPAWRDAIENIVDQDTQTGYTLLMPSNDAIERMSAGQLDGLLASGEQMSQLIDNHILDSAESIEIGGAANRTLSRYLRSRRLQLNQHRDRQLTLNGKRVVYANQLAPGGGRIHVIDGLLDWPSGRLLDIMDTLKQCDKFDGFVTLAEGTGLAQILKQDEPLTVFVPSNEALRKIPDEELEVIKNNSTALREFIMYHIVNGSYFSQDLRDGQQLSSILDMKPIQVGVRVDGCSRRLVEANTSPMRRPDIVAKNGVIHILDWYLTTRDNEWCDQLARSQGSLTSSSSSSPATPRDSSERLQQLASEPEVVISSTSSVSSSGSSSGSSGGSPITINNQHSITSTGYATRMNALPANHKQEQPATDELEAQASAIKPTLTTKTGERLEQAHSVYVAALPLSEFHK